MSTQLNVAMVGASPFAIREHLPAVRNNGGVMVTLCDHNGARVQQLAAQHAVPNACTDYHDAIGDPTVDVVAVCTPPSSHAEIAIAALQAGKHVYMEKPPTATAEEMERVAKAAEESGRCIYSGSHHLHRENVSHLRALIDREELGDVYAIDAWKFRRNSAPCDNDHQTKPGGIAMGSTTHRIDMVLHLLGIPEVQYVTARTYNYFALKNARKAGIARPSGMVEDSVIATIHFRNGCTATIRDMLDANMAQSDDDHGWFGDFTVFGSEAGAKLHPLTIYRNEDDGGLAVHEPPVNNDLHAGHTPVYAYLFECIRTGSPPAEATARSRLNMRIIEAMYASAAAGGKQIAF